MSINVALSRIFLVSTDSNFSQRLATVSSSKFELSTFENWDSTFHNIHRRPSAIFLDIENELAEAIPFIDKILDFDTTISIILISKNNNITNLDNSLKSNLYNCC